MVLLIFTIRFSVLQLGRNLISRDFLWLLQSGAAHVPNLPAARQQDSGQHGKCRHPFLDDPIFHGLADPANALWGKPSKRYHFGSLLPRENIKGMKFIKN
ncbi:MAG TPA: hypothetical protein VMG31_01715 [Verrucomicrobiae bacterium]|nr:hypothetical protein [Verrucomicrobiae bacterium]